MEPEIRYAKTRDGVSIAYWTMGDGGPPLIMSPPFAWSHIQREWEIPECRRWYEELAARRMLVRYDPRGAGLSDSDVGELSLQALVRDLEAVVNRLELDKFSLIGSMDLGPAAIAYCGSSSERVSRLILWCAYASGSDLAVAPETMAWIELMQRDWQLGTQSWANNMVGWSDSDLAHRLATLWRESCSPQALIDLWRESLQFDADSHLSKIHIPALILHRREIRILTVDSARRLASMMPNARLVVFDGAASLPYAGDVDEVIAAIDGFLGEGQSTKASTDPSPGTAIILFADIADSTALTERLGDTAFREKARDLDTTLRAVIREHSGTPIEGKLLGDGVLATFASARQAIEAALACGAAGASAGLPLHLGLHAGDVIREKDAGERENVFGGAVNIAARISALSVPGEVLVSHTVRDLARTSAGVAFEDRGERSLKGVGEPVRVWAVLRGPQARRPVRDDRTAVE